MNRLQENELQTAVAMALDRFCEQRNLRQFPPYANQQGADKRKYCVDLLGIMDGADLILLEFKVLNIVTGRLYAFDEEQHRNALEFERLGIPLAYAYNDANGLFYDMPDRPPDWHVDTLERVRRSAPLALPGIQPNIQAHQTLREWLDQAHEREAATLFGRMHGAVKRVSDLRNGLLVLLYSVEQQAVAQLTPKEVLTVVNLLRKDKGLNQHQLTQPTTLLGASADVFSRFASASGTPRATRSHSNRP